MTIDLTKNGTALTMTVAGRLDTTTAPQLSESFEKEKDGIQSLILDFVALDYISSAGLRVILQMQKTMSKREGMIVKNINETVKEVFDVTGFIDILTIE